MIKANYLIFLVAILFIGTLIRFWGLGEYPGGFFRDEAALGYNAYSIWKSGADEYGIKFPIVFRSFEVFFLPAYVYLSAPIVGIFGLSEFSARFVSTLSGVILLLLTWLISYEIWKDKKVSLIATLVLSISPWHIFFSRGAFEGNLALTFFAAGFLFLLKFANSGRPKFLFFSSLVFTASMYSYQAERLAVPVFALFSAILIHRKLLVAKKTLVITAVTVLIFLSPLLSLTFNAGGYHRAYGVSIFSQAHNPPGWVEGRDQGFLVNNAVYLRVREIAALYLSYFSPRNLVIEGDYDRQRSVDNFSVFYPWMFPFLVLGLWQSLQNRNLGKNLLLIWMLVGPLPASVTGDTFHTYRSLLFYLPLSLFIASGIGYVLRLFSKASILFWGAALTISFISLLQFSFSYFVLNQVSRAPNWDFGYRELVTYLKTIPGGTTIVVDDPKTTPYIQFLFFGGVDPQIYQKEVSALLMPENYYSDTRDLRAKQFSNFQFRPFYWPVEPRDRDAVLVTTHERFLQIESSGNSQAEVLKEINYPDGKPAFRVLTTAQ